jgi:hypothetical protein
MDEIHKVLRKMASQRSVWDHRFNPIKRELVWTFSTPFSKLQLQTLRSNPISKFFSPLTPLLDLGHKNWQVPLTHHQFANICSTETADHENGIRGTLVMTGQEEESKFTKHIPTEHASLKWGQYSDRGSFLVG